MIQNENTETQHWKPKQRIKLILMQCYKMIFKTILITIKTILTLQIHLGSQEMIYESKV